MFKHGEATPKPLVTSSNQFFRGLFGKMQLVRVFILVLVLGCPIEKCSNKLCH